MAAKYFWILCASTYFFKVITAQCVGAAQTAEEFPLSGNPYAYGPGIGPYGPAPLPYGSGYGPTVGYGINVAPTSGGGFQVTSSSPISPTGISIVSENTIEGPISISGQLPFLGAIAVEGALASAGAGAINYGCGTGSIGIVSESIAPAAPAGYNAGYGAPGMGYSGIPGPRPFNGPGY